MRQTNNLLNIYFFGRQAERAKYRNSKCDEAQYNAIYCTQHTVILSV